MEGNISSQKRLGNLAESFAGLPFSFSSIGAAFPSLDKGLAPKEECTLEVDLWGALFAAGFLKAISLPFLVVILKRKGRKENIKPKNQFDKNMQVTCSAHCECKSKGHDTWHGMQEEVKHAMACEE